jgi:NADPH:quinone reductase-like Zn-dependent oxidoreductase
MTLTGCYLLLDMVAELAKESDHIVGHDFAGIIEGIGSEVLQGTRKIGERVAGSVHGGKFILYTMIVIMSD